ncbi:MAG TPA: LysM domain-containing protein [Candidatus Binatia bacterium]|nr:LysM domain-containing protein [Candidatus Binatia bacterium]
MKSSVRLAMIAIAVGLAGACSHLPEMPPMPSIGARPEATPGLSPRDRVRLAVELLDGGDEQRAELELRAALEEQPNNGAAQRLLQQITEDPRALLTATPRPYTVRQGDSMSALAERYLGDALMFYALARYNDLEAPNQLSAGQRLMIPMRPGVIAASAPPNDAAAPPASTAALPLRTGDPERANQLRLQGLQQLNAGNVDSAISLLRQAQSLDAGNPAIQRDLDRALRLQAALGSGRG